MSAKKDYRRGGAVLVVRLEPPGKSRLWRLANIFNLPQYVGGTQLVSGMSSRVHRPAHLAYLMGLALERRDVPANEAGHYVLRCEAGIP
jgi:hypothetical protein